MRFSNKDNAEFDAFVLREYEKARSHFEDRGHDDAEDMAQLFAMRLSSRRAAFILDNPDEGELQESIRAALYVIEMECLPGPLENHKAHIAAARNIPYHHTPYNVLIAAEMAERAECEGLMPVVMGDTLAEEAEHFNMSRQRIHQMVNRGRDILSEYLISD